MREGSYLYRAAQSDRGSQRRVPSPDTAPRLFGSATFSLPAHDAYSRLWAVLVRDSIAAFRSWVAPAYRPPRHQPHQGPSTSVRCSEAIPTPTTSESPRATG